ncbi:MAG: hypothetical protein ACK5O3_04950, partial [Burkholderiales bacterium]
MTIQFDSAARRHIRKICFFAIGLALAAIGYLLFSDEQLASEAKANSGTSGAASFALQSPPILEKASAPANVHESNSKAPQTGAAAATEGMLKLTNSTNPYPILVALHARGGPGDFAMVRRFMRECAIADQLAHAAKKNGLLQGNSSLNYFSPSTGKDPNPSVETTSDIHAQRVLALQQIFLRCGQNGQGAPFFDPHPSDQYAKKLGSWHEAARTKQQLLDAHMQQAAAVTDYALQIEIVKQHMSEFSGFKSENQIEGLLYLADFASQADPAAPGNSLRGLAACVSVGQCGNPSSTPSSRNFSSQDARSSVLTVTWRAGVVGSGQAL